MMEKKVNFDRLEQAVALFGSFDENVKLISKTYNVAITSRGGEIRIAGEPEEVEKASRVIESLLQMINQGEALNEQNIRYCMSLVEEGTEEKM